MIVERSLSLYKGSFRKTDTNRDGQDLGRTGDNCSYMCLWHNICIIADDGNIDDVMDDGSDDDGSDDDDDGGADADNKRNGIMINLPWHFLHGQGGNT